MTSQFKENLISSLNEKTMIEIVQLYVSEGNLNRPDYMLKMEISELILTYLRENFKRI